MIFIPVIAAFLQAGSVTLDKIILNLKKTDYKTYIGASFPMILLINIIAFLIFKPALNAEMLSFKIISLVVISSILSIIGNFLFYRALQHDCLSEMETIALFSNIPLIVFTSIFFISERNPMIIALALVSSLFIVWSHWNHKKFQISKLTMAFLIFILLLSPFRGIIAKHLLSVLDSISLNLFVSILPAVFFFFYYFKNMEKASGRAWLLLLATNILSSITWILYYFSYQKIGIVHTVLIFSLQPLLVYFSSIFILKEKIHWKKFLAFLIVLVCIALSQIL
jgi:drug/metabolite transporter (DMT)-like permease